METLITTITDRVNVMVNEYIYEVLQRVSKAHNIPIEQLKEHLDFKQESTPFAKKIEHVVESDQVLMCSMKTKSGTQCKYKCLSGLNVCKKHQKLQDTTNLKEKETPMIKKTTKRNSKSKTTTIPTPPVTASQLPADEQAWFEESTYTQSYYPKSPEEHKFNASQDSEMVDDTNPHDAYVLDE